MVELNTQKQPKSNGFVTLIVVIVLSVVMITAWSNEDDDGFLHSAKNVVATIASPFNALGSVVAIPFNAIGNASTNASATGTDYLTLQQENAQLQAELAELETLEQENERLTDLLEIQGNYDIESVAARIVARSSDSWNRTVTIDKGRTDGMEAGMAVMDASGVLGQIESVAANTSVVRLITDESSGVSVTLQDAGEDGILTGSVDGVLYLEYIPISTTVEVGDTVVTSGLGGVYPKGIIVGTVVSVEGSSTDTYHTIIVQPNSVAYTTQEVLVVTGDQTEVTYDDGTSDEDDSEDEDDSDTGSGSTEDADEESIEDGDDGSETDGSDGSDSSDGSDEGVSDDSEEEDGTSSESEEDGEG